MILKYAALGLALVVGASAARADLTITVGDHELQPDTPFQPVQIIVSGGDAVEAVQVECQIGNGALNGDITAPTISELDVTVGTIFSSNHFGQTPLLTGVINRWLATRGTWTASGTVAAEGLLATVYIDTTGFTSASGPWTLSLSDTRNGSTIFGDIEPTIVNGSISIQPVPEPATALFLATGAALLLRRRGTGSRRAG
jgi:hypothetical protein